MKAYASIHLAEPSTQKEHEAGYDGYKRVLVDCPVGEICMRINFPEIGLGTEQVMTHVAIGDSEHGDGKVFLTLAVIPHVPLIKMHPGIHPRVAILYPDELPVDARITHQMVSLGRLRTEDMHPEYFERVNDALAAVGIPILKVVRQGTAAWEGKMSNMPSLSNWFGDGEAH